MRWSWIFGGSSLGSWPERNICNCIFNNDYVHCTHCTMDHPLFVCLLYILWFVEIVLVWCQSHRYFNVQRKYLLPFLTHELTLPLVTSNCDCFQDRFFLVHYFSSCVWLRIQLKCLRGQCTQVSGFAATNRTVTYADFCVNIKLTWWHFRRYMAWQNWHQNSLTAVFSLHLSQMSFIPFYISE